MKRFFDIVFSLTCICITLPIMIFVGVMIKLTSHGPIFFFQERVGYLGKHFIIYKFRTMIPKAEFGHHSALKNDPRITWIGQYLRLIHIDEFPQFFNILKGEMSFVGPRPDSVRYHNAQVSKLPNWNKRLSVRPGLTNLAVVKIGLLSVRRSSSAILLYDTFYIQHKSMKFDLFVIYLTVLYFIHKLKTPAS